MSEREKFHISDFYYTFVTGELEKATRNVSYGRRLIRETISLSATWDSITLYWAIRESGHGNHGSLPPESGH